VHDGRARTRASQQLPLAQRWQALERRAAGESRNAIARSYDTFGYQKGLTVQLIKRHLHSPATVNYTRVSHRHTAIEYTIAGVAKLHDDNLNSLGHDPFTSEMEGTMRDWVIETILQGAYLREYHLWEKDCKAYFVAMAERNGASMTMKTKAGQSFPQLIEETLVMFEVTVPADILGAIEHMRQKVNTMKHDAGLELDHFISERDYTAAVAALEGFWEYLVGCERITA
jgi:hypothetical protein